MGNLYMEAEQINYRNNDYPELNTVKKVLDSNQEYLSDISREVGVLTVDKANVDTIADTFSTEVSYLEGDYCMEDLTLYKFTSDHAGDWDSGDVSSTTLTDELKLKQNATDNSLTTTAKTVSEAINELDSDIANSKYSLIKDSEEVTDNTDVTLSNISQYNTICIEFVAQTGSNTYRRALLNVPVSSINTESIYHMDISIISSGTTYMAYMMFKFLPNGNINVIEVGTTGWATSHYYVKLYGAK